MSKLRYAILPVGLVWVALFIALVHFTPPGSQRTNQLMIGILFFLLLPASVGMRVLGDRPHAPELVIHVCAIATGAAGSWLMCAEAFPFRGNVL